ncbi:MAG TPA: MotA/TolQ/ExbB proton channel family protein [Bryobacteraceae bacterium]|jgi:chemotaxis protein MotA
MPSIELVPDNSTQGVKARLTDHWMLGGLLLGALAVIAGIALSGAGLIYFLQPSSALIVLGGTIGITLVTSPKDSLRMVSRRIRELAARPHSEREALIEEIVELARIARRGGMVSIEPHVPKIKNEYLRNGLLTALDVRDITELQVVLENELKLSERHGQADANALETAAGYAPTIGILGTVVGLIEVLKHFSDVHSIGPGIGAAFVSTIYGLATANFLLLPLAHRIHARVADATETQELIAEGVMCIFASMHPSIVRQRLAPYLRETEERERVLNSRRRMEVMNQHAGAS